MVDGGVLIRDAKPCYYVYRLTWRGRTQTGLACAASLADYATNRIRKHELTTPLKEDDRVRQIEAVNAQTGPVMIGYPNAPEIDALLAQAAAGKPDVDVTADDGVRHQMWVVADDATIGKLSRAFDALPAIYIADGHHRSAAAARVAAARKGDGSHQIFPVGDLPRTRDDHPRLQSRGERSERPHARAVCHGTWQELHGDAVIRAGAPGFRARVRHVSRRPLVQARPSAPNWCRAIRSAGCRSPCSPAT